MSDLRARLISGNGNTEKPLSTHIVEMVILSGSSNSRTALEEAYTRIAERAKAEDSLILSVFQSVSAVVLNSSLAVVAIVTAQRISRAEFEQQQRLQRMGR